MGNMSYCRFHNTLSALRDCEEVINMKLDGEESSDTDLSREEFEAAVKLVSMCDEIALRVREYLGLEENDDLKKDSVRDALNGNA